MPMWYSAEENDRLYVWMRRSGCRWHAGETQGPAALAGRKALPARRGPEVLASLAQLALLASRASGRAGSAWRRWQRWQPQATATTAPSKWAAPRTRRPRRLITLSVRRAGARLRTDELVGPQARRWSNCGLDPW